MLRLVEGFTVEGEITLPDWTHLNYAGERRITIAAQRGNVWRSLATLRYVQDGPWGPVALPIVDAANYRIRLEGSPIIPEMVDFEPPPPGTRLSFDLQAELGNNVMVEAIDEEGKPVPTAEATVWWWEDGRRNFVRRRALPDGYINLWSMPAGTVYFIVEAPGYITAVSQAFTLPLNVAVQFVLKRGSRLQGHCMHAGRPVEDFEVIVWRSGLEFEKQTHTFHGRKDGSFQLDTVPIGEVFVTASAETLVGGQPVLIRLGEDSPEDVTLELFEPLLGGGVVVDAETDEPISSATVQTYIMGDWGRLEGFGPPVPARSDGTFEIRAFVKGKNIVTLQAPGYADFVHTFFAEEESTADIGRIGLLRPQTLEIQLVDEGLGESSVDFSSIVAGSDAQPILPQTPFSSSGLVRFENQSPGPRMVVIDRPGFPWVRLNLNLRSGEDWRIVHRIAGMRRLAVEVVPEPGETLDGIRAILVDYESGQGVITSHGAALPPDGLVSLDGIDAEAVMVSVLDGNWETVALGEGSFAGADELYLTIPLGGAPYLFRVVDGEGLPVSGTTILVNDSQPSVLFLSGTTDEQGECKLKGVPVRAVLVHLIHQTRGTRHGILVDGTAGKVELVLRSDAELNLQFLDGETPLRGIGCWLVNKGGESLTHERSSDAAGHVLWTGLSPGIYRVSASHPDCWGKVFEAEASEEAAPTVVQIRRLGDLLFEIRASNGLPVLGQSIKLWSVEFDTDVGTWVSKRDVKSTNGLVSDQKGRIQVKGLPNGIYRWSLLTSAGEVLQGEVEVPPKEKVEFVITIP